MKDKTNEHHQFFHSFCSYPKIKFSIQENDEEIILVLRMHPITQIFWLVNGIIFFIVLFLFNIFFSSYFSLNQIFFFNIFFISLIFSYLWFNFLNWYFNVGIITNKRVIDIDYHGVIYKEFTVAKLNKIEDITSKTGGYLQSIFDYGNVFIQTAGTEVNIEFINIPQPSKVVSVINNLLTRHHGF